MVGHQTARRWAQEDAHATQHAEQLILQTEQARRNGRQRREAAAKNIFEATLFQPTSGHAQAALALQAAWRGKIGRRAAAVRMQHELDVVEEEIERWMWIREEAAIMLQAHARGRACRRLVAWQLAVGVGVVALSGRVDGAIRACWSDQRNVGTKSYDSFCNALETTPTVNVHHHARTHARMAQNLQRFQVAA